MNKLNILIAAILMVAGFSLSAQVAISTNGSSANSSAMLDVQSTSKGFLLPRMSQIQRNAITTPATGLMVWCGDCGTYGELQIYNGSSWKGLIAVTASGTLPGAPTIGTAVRGNVEASVPYTAPASDGGSTITSYTATSNPGGFTGTLSQAGSGTITVTGLTNGTTYTFTVTATNAVGTGAASAASNSVTPATVPGAPTIGTATAGNAQALVPFTAPASNGGLTITSYTATSVVGGKTGTLTQAGSGTITVSGLTNGTAYTFTVTATNDVGTSATSAVSNSVTPSVPVLSVTNPTTGKIWVDRNLGATQVAISKTDAASYGYLYQWGRLTDGHQIRGSLTTTTLSGTDVPANGKFIIVTSGLYDWRSPQNVNLWQGVNGINNPCPAGYRIPTSAELDAERMSWSSQNATGAFGSPLKFTIAGNRNYYNGSVFDAGSAGFYWSSTVNGTDSDYLYFNDGSFGANMSPVYRGAGHSIRCIKD